MATDLSVVDSILKEFYIDTVPDALNSKVAMLDMFKKGANTSADGREVTYPFRVGRNTGTGAIGELGNLPIAGSQKYADWKIPFKYNYVTVMFSAQAVEHAKTSKGAFVTVFDNEIKKAVEDQSVGINRQLWGTGRGDLAHVATTAATTTTIAIKNPGGVSGTVNPCRFLAVGQKIAGITLGTPNVISWYGTIASMDNAAGTITLGAAVSVTANDVIVSTSVVDSSISFADTGFNNEVMGLSGMVDDGTNLATYHGVSRATTPQAKSWLRTVSGALTLNDLQIILDSIEEGGKGKASVLWGHQTARRAYLNLLASFRRYNDAFAKNPDGGFKAAGADIQYADLPFKVDRFAPYKQIFALDASTFRKFSMTEKWADETGAIMKPVEGKDAYQGQYRMFNNFHCELPNSNGKIVGFDTDTPIYVPYL